MVSLLREMLNQIEKANIKHMNNATWSQISARCDDESVWVTFSKLCSVHENNDFNTQLEVIRTFYNKLEPSEKELFEPLMQAAGDTTFQKNQKETEQKCKETGENELVVHAQMINPASPSMQFGKLAELYIKENPIYYDSKTKIWWAWKDKEKKWDMQEDVDILRNFKDKYAIVEWIHPVIRARIIDTLKVYAGIKPKDAPHSWIQFGLEIYDIETQKTFPATSEYFHTNPIPHKLGTSAETPEIDKLFSEWVGQKANTLLEVFAYSLLRDYPLQRIFVLLGTGANGKGTYMSLLRKFLGNDNVTSSEIDMLASPEARFERAKLMNKLVCTVGETNVGILKTTSILKQLSGGDLIGAEIKNKNPFTFVNFAKIIICSNALPMTTDKTEGFYRRWLIIEYPNKFGEGEDPNSKITETEMENLCLKCVRTLETLLKTKKFSSDGSVEERTKRYEDYSNPVRRFIQENYIKNEEGFVRKTEFNDDLLAFLKNHGYRLMTEYEINRMLKSLGHEIKKKRIDEENEEGVIESRPYSCILGISKINELEKSGTSGTNDQNVPENENLLKFGNNESGKSTPYNTPVPDVPNVPRESILIPYIGSELYIAGTSGTSGTNPSQLKESETLKAPENQIVDIRKVRESILENIRTYEVAGMADKALVLNEVISSCGATKEQAEEQANLLLAEGLIATVDEGHWRLVMRD